jgi:DMSO/TMAO reductase YedYZ molybdopterin-dependent catalytic subunit
MPTSRFYIRNHFQIPRLSSDQWRLKIDGLVDEPLHLSLQDLIAMPSEVTQVTLECAGNGRSALEPRVAGEQWNFGAVSTAEWTGVPVLEVLKRAGVREDARYIVFRGADQGTVDETSGPIFFERALSIEEARESNAMLAYVMNGEPLPPKHGYPVRVIVPSWYAVASVKWLAEITLTSEPLQAHYQTETYYFERESNGTITREPVSFQRVRSLTTEPAEGAELRPGPLSVRGVAWSGVAPIARVEVSLNGGEWAEARLLGEPERHRWQRWEWTTSVDEPGPHQVRSRAFDEAGRIQPDVPEWNRLGYGNNAILPVNFRITA